jgi:preprotein translocase subunit YajC
MSDLKAGDRVIVKDRPNYTLGGWQGEVVEVKEDPKGWIIIKADKTGYRMAFPESELEKVQA